ncbi:MAG: serine/threonine protein kinase [Myxococcota bacterium]
MTAPTDKKPRKDPLLGQVLEDRYRIIEQIGAGGMGRVYRATQIRMERDIAVKVLPVDRELSRNAIARFEREARVASMLRHPNSIVTFDFGESPFGLYIAMELLEGITIHERIRRGGAMAPRVAARVGAGIVASLAEAHENGIIHRDLKPHNIFLHRVRELDVIKVLDFGIAKLYDTKADSQAEIRTTAPDFTNHTSRSIYQTASVPGDAGSLLGTCVYMSPEHIRGDKLDGRSDIYAVGCILHELLTGKPPFIADTVRATLRLHLDAPVPTLPESIDEELRILVTVMMSKDRERRPRTADEVLAGLLRYLGEAPSVAAFALEPFDLPEEPVGSLELGDSPGPQRPPSKESTKPPKAAAPPASSRLENAPTRYRTGDMATRPKAPPTIRGSVLAGIRIPQRVRLANRITTSPKRSIGLVIAVAVSAIFVAAWAMDSSSETSAENARPGATAGTVPTFASEPNAWKRVEPGTASIGSRDSQTETMDQTPRHAVQISKAYALKTTEVTRSEWKQVMGTGVPAGPECADNCPAAGVSWWDAIAFCNSLSDAKSLPRCYELEGCTGSVGADMTCAKVEFAGTSCTGYRLPTEAEWEYAARAIDDTSYTLQEREGLAPDARQLAPVGRDRANAWGLHGTLGGVSEWVWDRYGAEYYAQSSPVDPTGPNSGSLRVRRGCNYQDSGRRCRYAHRDRGRPDETFPHTGFRPARTLP